MSNKVTTYFHAVNAGDLIAAMAGLKEIYRKTGRKAIIYQQLDREAAYYPGATHPTLNEKGAMVSMNREIFNMIKPLVTSQCYTADFKIWEGEKVDINLDRIHGEVFVNMPHGSINRWLFYAFPDMACDLSKKWIDPHYTLGTVKVFGEYGNKIIINRTSRYHNGKISYHFLRPLQDQCLFVGTVDEHKEFCREWSLKIDHFIVSDFAQLARLLSISKLFLGNQSMCWNIAEAMKIPRVLEVCPWAENCIPNGTDGYDCYYNGGMEYYVNEILNRR